MCLTAHIHIYQQPRDLTDESLSPVSFCYVSLIYFISHIICVFLEKSLRVCFESVCIFTGMLSVIVTLMVNLLVETSGKKHDKHAWILYDQRMFIFIEEFIYVTTFYGLLLH